MSRKIQPGPVQDRLSLSKRQDIRALCHMNKSDLLVVMDTIVASNGLFDQERFVAAQDLLDERAPTSQLEDDIKPLSLEEFRAKYADALAQKPE